jgi:predicted Zn-dependent protease with MMP-like domain
VREAVAGLPPALRGRIDNVDIIVRGRPTPAELRQAGIGRGGTLLGLYQGIPLPQRHSGYHMTLPDRIYLFRQPLEEMCATEEELVRQIRRTVLHELAHHFGISDERLAEIGAY